MKTPYIILTQTDHLSFSMILHQYSRLPPHLQMMDFPPPPPLTQSQKTIIIFSALCLMSCCSLTMSLIFDNSSSMQLHYDRNSHVCHCPNFLSFICLLFTFLVQTYWKIPVSPFDNFHRLTLMTRALPAYVRTYIYTYIHYIWFQRCHKHSKRESDKKIKRKSH